MVRALFDTNILIDHLDGNPLAELEVEGCRERAISIVTWMEVMVGCPPQHDAETRRILAKFQRVPITPEIAERTVLIRRQQRLKLPDAVILASAIVGGWLLITRNTRDFREESGVIRIPYRI